MVVQKCRMLQEIKLLTITMCKVEGLLWGVEFTSVFLLTGKLALARRCTVSQGMVSSSAEERVRGGVITQ